MKIDRGLIVFLIVAMLLNVVMMWRAEKLVAEANNQAAQANRNSADNNAILRDRNRYFVEYTEQVRAAREDHRVIMARCGQ